MDCYEDGISFTRKHKGLQDLFQNDVETVEEQDGIDPDYEQYLQDDFQDTIIENLFKGIALYVNTHAINICEYLTRDDIEILLNDIEKN